jgi:DNA invertase Pin-like site-specific DNA recombinase
VIALIAYYRVSTKKQGESKLGLEGQQASVRDYARRLNVPIAAEFTEVESGWLTADRPQLAAALERARVCGGTIVVAKLDRLARDVRLTMDLMDGDVPHVYLDYPQADPTTASGWLMVVMASVMAEYESRRGSERVKAALARRHARLVAEGKAEPKPPPSPPKGRNRVHTRSHQQHACAAWHAQDRTASAEFRKNYFPLVEALREKHGTLEAVADHLNACGIRTRRGRKWSAGTVHWLLKK